MNKSNEVHPSIVERSVWTVAFPTAGRFYSEARIGVPRLSGEICYKWILAFSWVFFYYFIFYR